MILVKIFYALGLIACGFYLIKYRRVVKGWTGTFLWAEKYLGNGGTYIVLILTGLFLMFWGVLYPFGGLSMIFGIPAESPSEVHEQNNTDHTNTKETK